LAYISAAESTGVSSTTFMVVIKATEFGEITRTHTLGLLRRSGTFKVIDVGTN